MLFGYGVILTFGEIPDSVPRRLSVVADPYPCVADLDVVAWVAFNPEFLERMHGEIGQLKNDNTYRKIRDDDWFHRLLLFFLLRVTNVSVKHACHLFYCE